MDEVRNKLGVQSRSNILSPDGGLTQVPNRNTLNWSGYPGPLVPIPAPAVAALAPPSVLFTRTGTSAFPVSPFTATTPFNPAPGSTLVIVYTGGPNNNASGSPTAISAVKDNFGNNFTQVPGFYQDFLAGAPFTPVECFVDCWYITNCAAGITGITCDFTGAQGLTFCIFYLSPCTLQGAGTGSTEQVTTPGPVNGPALNHAAAFFLTAFMPTITAGDIVINTAGWSGALGAANDGQVAYITGTGPQQCQFSFTGGPSEQWAIAGAVFA